MAEPNAKPKTSKPRTPKAKPTPPGQGTMDFNGGSRGGALQRWQPDFVRVGKGKSQGGSNQILADIRRDGVGYNAGGAKGRNPVRQPGGYFLMPGRGNIYDVSSSRYNPGREINRDVYSTGPIQKSGASQAARGLDPGKGQLALRPQPPYPVVPPRPIDGGKVNTPNLGPKYDRYDLPPFERKPIDGGKVNTPNPGPVRPKPITNTPNVQVRPKPGALQVVDKADDAAKVIGGVVKGRPKSKWGLLAAGLGAAALGTGYLMSRRNENEDAAKPQQAGTSMNVPGRNAPPSEGNRADRELYSPAPEGSTKKAAEPGLSERVRNNQKANRSPDDYLGEAFDATVKRGRDVGRKHLQGMLVRDSVDSDTATKLMNRYDKEIGAQRTLRDYKSEGIAQRFDRENPGKAGRILDEYRAMGRREGAAPAGATYAQIKERALR